MNDDIEQIFIENKPLNQVVCGIVYDRDTKKILLLKKAAGDYAGLYEFPGGKREKYDKSIKKCLERELLEEINCYCDINELIYYLYLPKLDINLYFYNTELATQYIELSEEHTEYKWVKIKEAYNLKMNSEDYKLLKYLETYF